MSNGKITQKEILLNERINQEKNSKSWPEKSLLQAKSSFSSSIHIAENRDVHSTTEYEEALNKIVPFYDHLSTRGLSQYTTKSNDKIVQISHHLAHAYSAIAVSPFKKALIVVIDGAGSRQKDFNQFEDQYDKSLFCDNSASLEERSVFLFENGTLKPVLKQWHLPVPSNVSKDIWYSEGLGFLYENGSSFVFGNNRATGKLMGLAAYGKAANRIKNRIEFQHNLNWNKAFKGRGKKDWESSENLNYFQEIASQIQTDFENDRNSFLKNLRQQFPEYGNLILTGGTALNCTANMKLVNEKLFDSIYVPPNPGDESIGSGCAYYLYYKNYPTFWKETPHELQHGYWGPISSVPNKDTIRSIFKDYDIVESSNVAKDVAKILFNGEIIAWFQGRSESGPRALGNRSILARVDLPNLKMYLNDHIKFRESFRPYGCSILWDVADTYFDIPSKFDNPFMSFSPKIKPQYKDLLKEVMHVDGTSRMQTVRRGQNELYYNLLFEFGKLSGFPCLLNTSLNIMNKPIVETVQDAFDFFTSSKVNVLVVDGFIVKKERDQ